MQSRGVTYLLRLLEQEQESSPSLPIFLCFVLGTTGACNVGLFYSTMGACNSCVAGREGGCQHGRGDLVVPVSADGLEACGARWRRGDGGVRGGRRLLGQVLVKVCRLVSYAFEHAEVAHRRAL